MRWVPRRDYFGTKYGAVHLSMRNLLRKRKFLSRVRRDVLSGGTLSKGDMVDDAIVNMIVETSCSVMKALFLDGLSQESNKQAPALG